MYEKRTKQKRIIINGSQIQNYSDFINIIQKELNFPRDCNGNVNRYLDWMRDLQWTSFNVIQIIIKNSSYLINSDNRDLQGIIFHFQNIIIPFWKDEYQNCIVEPVPKEIILKLE